MTQSWQLYWLFVLNAQIDELQKGRAKTLHPFLEGVQAANSITWKAFGKFWQTLRQSVVIANLSVR